MGVTRITQKFIITMKLVCFTVSLLAVFVTQATGDPSGLIDTLTPAVQESIYHGEVDEDTSEIRQLFKKKSYGYGKGVVRPTYSKALVRPVYTKKAPMRPVDNKKAPVAKTPACFGKGCGRYLFKKKRHGYIGKVVRPTYSKSFVRPAYTKKAAVRPVFNKEAPVTKAPVCVGKGCGRYLFKKKIHGYSGKGKVVRPTYSKSFVRPAFTKTAPVRPVYTKKAPVAKAPVCFGKGCGRYLFKKKNHGYSGKGGKVVRPTYSKSFVRPAYTKKAPVRPVYTKKAPVAKAPVCFSKGCGRYLFKKKNHGYSGKGGKVVRPTYSKSLVRPAYTKKAPVRPAYNKKTPVAKAPVCFGKGCGRYLFKKKGHGYSGKGKVVRPTCSKSFVRPAYTKKAPVRPVYSKKAPVAKAPVCFGKGCGRYLFKKKTRGYSRKGKFVRPTYSKSFVRPAYTKKAVVRPVYKKAPVTKAHA